MDHIGTGNFGRVYSGVLESGVKVAVKTLKEGSVEKDMVRFLQEAAIMGQFKHHNVVEVYGVVTIGEPVSQMFEECLIASYTSPPFSVRTGIIESNYSQPFEEELETCTLLKRGVSIIPKGESIGPLP